AWAALIVFHLRRLDRALPGADPADAAHPLLAAEELPLDVELFLAGLRIDDKTRRAVAILGIHVFVPEIERLQDVTIGVDDVVDAAHQLSSADKTRCCGIVTQPCFGRETECRS